MVLNQAHANRTAASTSLQIVGSKHRGCRSNCSLAAGFIYPVLTKAIGFSRGSKVVPASRPLLLFDGNTAHSSGYMW